MNDATITITRLLTDKRALNHSRIDVRTMPLALAQGEVLLKPAGQRVLRREATGRFQRVEQAHVWHGVLPAR